MVHGVNVEAVVVYEGPIHVHLQDTVKLPQRCRFRHQNRLEFMGLRSSRRTYSRRMRADSPSLVTGVLCNHHRTSAIAAYLLRVPIDGWEIGVHVRHVMATELRPGEIGSG